MKYHQCDTPFVCGVDLHSRMMHICIIDRNENVLVHKPINNLETNKFLEILKPYLGKIVVSCESTFNYYFLADFCKAHSVPFFLGHALYIKHIHGGKAKNDPIDSQKLAELTIKNYLPYAHSCSEEIRGLRDIMRNRNDFVQYRTALISKVKMHLYQANLPSLGEITEAQIRNDFITQDFLDENKRFDVATNLDTILFYNKKINEFEKRVEQQIKVVDNQHYKLLINIRGFGPIISTTILLEVDGINRFVTCKDFISYCRLIKCAHESAGKKQGYGGAKIGNPYLRYIFGEAAIHLARNNKEVKAYLDKLSNRYGKGKSYSILAHKIGRSIYYILKTGSEFNLNKFLAEK